MNKHRGDNNGENSVLGSGGKQYRKNNLIVHFLEVVSRNLQETVWN